MLGGIKGVASRAAGVTSSSNSLSDGGDRSWRCKVPDRCALEPAPFAARVQTQETGENLTVSSPDRKERGGAHLDASSAESSLPSSSAGAGCVAYARPTKARRLVSFSPTDDCQ
jgi:hypothetical protein